MNEKLDKKLVWWLSKLQIETVKNHPPIRITDKDEVVLLKAVNGVTSLITDILDECLGAEEVEYSNLDGNAGYWEKHGRNALRAQAKLKLKSILEK